VLTMSSTRTPQLRSFTGLARPCSIGPTAYYWALRCTALYVVLPVSRLGKTKTSGCRAEASQPDELVTLR
jgi:hypothetical protein